MREVKFRCWNTSAKCMYPPKHFGIAMNGDTLQLMPSCEHINQPYAVNNGGAMIFMQYTGFKSKSGAYIYDGDLLKNPNEPTITEVRWSDEDGCWEVYDHDLLAHHYKNLEVVGNIYEELLK
jgi:hypothetical protein